MSIPETLIRWQITQAEDGWRLLRDGSPFYIKGAVAQSASPPLRFDILKSCGGNAVRANASQATLDEAQQNGLVVMANLPVRAERNGMDWDDEAQVEEQKAKVLDIVRKLKVHPALMFWAIGNELDHIPPDEPYNRRLWARLNDIALAIKQIDPHHPVLTVVGTGHFEDKIQEIAEHCTATDLLGINSYGDLEKAANLAREHWPKPFVITEWGPTGHWEVPKTQWGAPLEQTSSEKAAIIRERYQNIIQADCAHCLGSFVFYWSEKQETTHTWYGLFCDGLRTESIDVMHWLWTGDWPTNRAPQIKALHIEDFTDPRSTVLQAEQTYRAQVTAVDPDDDALTFRWDIRPEVEIPAHSYAGVLEKKAEPLAGFIAHPKAPNIEFAAPTQPGAYRLFVTVTDGQSHIAYGNIPFDVADR